MWKEVEHVILAPEGYRSVVFCLLCFTFSNKKQRSSTPGRLSHVFLNPTESWGLQETRHGKEARPGGRTLLFSTEKQRKREKRVSDSDDERKDRQAHAGFLSSVAFSLLTFYCLFPLRKRHRPCPVPTQPWDTNRLSPLLPSEKKTGDC